MGYLVMLVTQHYIQSIARDFQEIAGTKVRQHPRTGAMFLTVRPPKGAARQLVLRWDMVSPGLYQRHATITSPPLTGDVL